MPINVPKIEAPQHPIGASLLPTALNAVLWPWREEVARKTAEKYAETLNQAKSAQGQSALEAVMNPALPAPNPEDLPKLPNGTIVPPPAAAPEAGTPALPDITAQREPGAAPSAISDLMAKAGLPTPGYAIGPGPGANEYKAPSGFPQADYRPVLRQTVNEAGLPTQEMVEPFGGKPIPNARQIPKYVPPKGVAYTTEAGDKGMKFVTPQAGADMITSPLAGEVARTGALSAAKAESASQPNALFVRAEKAAGITDPQQIWEDYKDYEKGKITARLAGIRWQAQPNGVSFDRMTGGYFDSKTKEQLSPEQVTEWQLSIKRLAPTERIKAMQQLASPLLDTIAAAREALQNASVGPAAGRINKILQGRIGADDPEFATYQTWQMLTTSLGTMMHTGLRPPVEIAKMFSTLTDAKQSPANLMAALNAWEQYATTLKNGQNIQFNIPAGGPAAKGKTPPAASAAPGGGGGFTPAF